MTLTANERAFLATLCPFTPGEVAGQELDDFLDAWFAADHFDNNPVYTWNDNESHTI